MDEPQQEPPTSDIQNLTQNFTNSTNSLENEFDSNSDRKPVITKRQRKERGLIICGNCGDVKPKGQRGMCQQCYNEKVIRPRRHDINRFKICVSCNMFKHICGKYMCGSCYSREANRRRKLDISRHRNCFKCSKLGPIRGNGLCGSCYYKQRPIQIILCPECNRLNPKGSKGMCSSCYAKKQKEYNLQNGLNDVMCCQCGEVRMHSAKGMCVLCYRNNPTPSTDLKHCTECIKKFKGEDDLCPRCITTKRFSPVTVKKEIVDDLIVKNKTVDENSNSSSVRQKHRKKSRSRKIGILRHILMTSNLPSNVSRKPAVLTASNLSESLETPETHESHGIDVSTNILTPSLNVNVPKKSRKSKNCKTGVSKPSRRSSRLKNLQSSSKLEIKLETQEIRENNVPNSSPSSDLMETSEMQETTEIQENHNIDASNLSETTESHEVGVQETPSSLNSTNILTISSLPETTESHKMQENHNINVPNLQETPEIQEDHEMQENHGNDTSQNLTNSPPSSPFPTITSEMQENHEIDTSNLPETTETSKTLEMQEIDVPQNISANSNLQETSQTSPILPETLETPEMQENHEIDVPNLSGTSEMQESHKIDRPQILSSSSTNILTTTSNRQSLSSKNRNNNGLQTTSNSTENSQLSSNILTPSNLTNSQSSSNNSQPNLSKKQKRLMAIKQVAIDNFKRLPSDGILTSLKGYAVAGDSRELLIVSDSLLHKVKAIDCIFNETLPEKIDGTFIEIKNVMIKPNECVFSKESNIVILKKDENDLMAKDLFRKAFKSKYFLAKNEMEESKIHYLEFIEQGIFNHSSEFFIKTIDLKTNEIIYFVVHGLFSLISEEIFGIGKLLVLKNAKPHENFSINGQNFSSFTFDENETKLLVGEMTENLSSEIITNLADFSKVKKGVVFKCNIGFIVREYSENQLQIIDGKSACFSIYNHRNEEDFSFEEGDQGKIEEASVMQGSVNGILKLCLHKVTKLDENADDLFEFDEIMPPMTSIYWNGQD